jgi:hypothetical protein
MVWVSLPERRRAKRNSFQERRNPRTPAAKSPGAERGKTTRKKAPRGVAPSTWAASSRSFGKPWKNPMRSQAMKGRAKARWARTRAFREPERPRARRRAKRGRARTMGGSIWVARTAKRKGWPPSR